MSYHDVVYAEEEDSATGEGTSSTTTTTSLWERLKTDGPQALTQMDYVLFTVLMLLAFELLDFVTKNSGSKFHQCWLCNCLFRRGLRRSSRV